MQKLLFMTLFMVSTVLGTSQDKIGDLIPLADFPESKTLSDYSQQYANAVVNADFDKVLELTHIDIIEKGGGAEFMKKDLEAEAKGLQIQGFSYTDVEVGNHPEFLSSDGQLQTLIPLKFLLTVNGQNAESIINLFAVSEDEGKSWKFVNLERFDEASLREFVSNVSSDLNYPE